MTFAYVLLVCLGGIAACATLVFVVETIAAFWLQKYEPVGPAAVPAVAEGSDRGRSLDRAA